VTRLLDVNLLMALLWENHEHHISARSWFKSVSAFATCPVVQLGFARVSERQAKKWGQKYKEQIFLPPIFLPFFPSVGIILCRIIKR